MINTSTIRLKVLTASAILVLSACAQSPDKMPADNGPDTHTTASVTAAPSATKAERDRYREGLVALNDNEIAKAQRIFGEFIRKRPELAGAYTNLAVIHFRKDEIDQALKLVDKAITLNPEQSQAYNLRAQMMVKQGKIKEAEADYNRAIELNPKYINAQYNLALLYDVYLQDIELAIKHYEIYMSLLKKPDQETKDWIMHLKGTLNNG
ncbi:MAG: tetratricopeptide repeat protein [Proteobacteria bacterium]|nr:tetratricopeptide repeat protein [Pseudomonadota bacterium]